MAYSGLVFSWEQNSADPLIERLTWLTDVLEHRDASEQRRMVRLDPRRQLEFSVLPLDDHERSALDVFMWGAMRSPVMVPIWSDPQTLQTQANSGQPVVTIPTTTYDFDVDHYICLWQDWDTYEVVQIASLTSSAVTCTQNLTSTWPVGTCVLPARLGRINPRQSSSRLGGGNLTPSVVAEGVCDVAPWKVVFDIDEASRSTNRLGSLSPTQYLGIDVYPADPDYSEALSLDMDAAFGIIDAQTGIVAIDSAAKIFPSQIFQYNDKLFSRADISTFLAYVFRWGGRRTPFWLTTGDNDFVPTAVETGLTGWLTYKATGYPTFVDSTNYRNAVAIRYLRNGTVYAAGSEVQRGIIAAEVLGGGLERIRIGLESIDTADYDKFRVSFLRYCRLESDLVELSWINGCMANVRLTMRELPDYPDVV